MQKRIWGRLLVWYFGNVNFEQTGTPKRNTQQIVTREFEALKAEIKAKCQALGVSE